MENERERAFDGLRGLAAVYVVVFHLAGNSSLFSSMSQIQKSILLVGSICVQIFFVLSGMFIVASLRKLMSTKTRPVRDFAVRRFFRIAPVWWILLIWMFAQGQISGKVLFGNSVFYFGKLNDSEWLPVVPAWSLLVEVFFYFLMALAVKPILAMKKSSLAVLWLTSLVVAGVWRYIGHNELGLAIEQIRRAPFNSLSFFAAGIVFEKWHRDGGRLEHHLNNAQIWMLEAFTIGMLASLSFQRLQVLPIEIYVPMLVVLVGCPNGLLNSVLRSRIFTFLGSASFGIYILQNVAGDFAARFAPFGAEGYVVFGSLLAVCMGVAAHYLIERPFISLGRKLQSECL